MALRTQDHGAAERLCEQLLSCDRRLWHRRAGVNDGGVWRPATRPARASGLPVVPPGLFVPAAELLYWKLLAVYRLDAELAARFGSYALLNSQWRDLKVAAAALLLAQPLAGGPVREADGTVAFFEEDYRAVGEAMLLWYQRHSTRMLTPTGILRVAQLLETPEIAAANRMLGFAEGAGRRPPLGRWPKAASRWLWVQEHNPPLLEGLVRAGHTTTIRRIARKCGYRPASEVFFRALRWPQTQAAGGHRHVGLEQDPPDRQDDLAGLSEEEICRRITQRRLGFAGTVGRLPAEVGLSPAVMAALLPSLSDRQLRIMTPTLAALGLLGDPEVRARWEHATSTATDQRGVNVARNVRDPRLRARLAASADAAARAAVTGAADGREIEVLFLIDASASMRDAIGRSKETLVRILAGFPPERLHIAAFNTLGRVLRPAAPTRVGVEHMLAGVAADGGTLHAAALRALHRDGVRVDPRAALVVIVVGDEDGEPGEELARAFTELGYAPTALAHIVVVAPGVARGDTLRRAAAALRVPYSEVPTDAFGDPYQVTRVLVALADAPTGPGSSGSGLLDRILATPLLEAPR